MSVVSSKTQKFSAALHRSGLDRLAQLSWRGLLILNYHRIGSPTDRDDPDLFSCTLDDLDRQVRLLGDRFELVAAGAVDLDLERPARRVAITVDDGYRDQLLAARVLESHRVPGTFFICTGYVDDPRPAWWDEIAWLLRDPLPELPAAPWLPGGAPAGGAVQEVRRSVNAAYKRTAGDEGEALLDRLAEVAGRSRLPVEGAVEQWMGWDDVRALRAAGMEVGAHTVTHPVLATLSELRQREEIEGSLVRLRAELQEQVDTFSYPVGARASFDHSTVGLLRELGVRRAFSFYGGINRGAVDRHDVRRAGVFQAHDPAVVVAMASLPAVLASPRRHA